MNNMDCFFTKGPDLFPVPSSIIVAIAGEDFAVIATDKNLTTNDGFPVSEQDKLFQVSSVVVMACTGPWGDAQALFRLMETSVSNYKFAHCRPMSINAMAPSLSSTMYNRRFSPCNVPTILAGIDNEGKGAVFSFDSFGHYQRVRYQYGGESIALVLPVLNKQLALKDQSFDAPTKMVMELTEALSIASKCMSIATTLDINTKGPAIVKIITKAGIEVRELPLFQK